MTGRSRSYTGELVATMAHQVCSAMVAQVAADDGIAVVTSAVPGVGKTRSATVAATDSGRLTVELVLSADTTPATANAELLRAMGARPVRGAQLWESTGEAIDALRDLDPIVVVDDAHDLSGEVLSHLGVLYRRTTMALVIVGGATLEKRDRTHPELWDRADRWVDMTPLSRAETLDALPRTHPLFATAPPSRLADIDHTHARGRWRRWDQFLRTALLYAPAPIGPLSDDVIDHTLTALRWDRRPDPTRRDRR